ncbi:hypothetical protein EVAR_35930_1 [Eumeta japonica]|uniref:Uncharacterized protein n=1 Tax=Eumeta variegata TaxID=151549 RepID=A0A4C1W3T4_EUMVA|nr:hypothetical protein EVAR_35930_1 [Eumeta japonica]
MRAPVKSRASADVRARIGRYPSRDFCLVSKNLRPIDGIQVSGRPRLKNRNYPFKSASPHCRVFSSFESAVEDNIATELVGMQHSVQVCNNATFCAGMQHSFHMSENTLSCRTFTAPDSHCANVEGSRSESLDQKKEITGRIFLPRSQVTGVGMAKWKMDRDNWREQLINRPGGGSGRGDRRFISCGARRPLAYPAAVAARCGRAV